VIGHIIIVDISLIAVTRAKQTIDHYYTHPLSIVFGHGRWRRLIM